MFHGRQLNPFTYAKEAALTSREASLRAEPLAVSAFSWQAPISERLCSSRRTRRISLVWSCLHSSQPRGHHRDLRRRSDLVPTSLPFHLSPASRSSLPAHR